MKNKFHFLLLLGLFLFCGCNAAVPANAPIQATEPPVTSTATSIPTDTPAPTVTPTPSPTTTPTPSPVPTATPTPTVTPTPTPVLTTITCSFAGDVTLGSDLINQNSIRNFYVVYDKVQDDSYFFANVLPIFAEDDLTLVNFEGVLSDRGERQDKTFAFRGLPSYVNILTEGSVEAVCLSNNHSLDYGQVSHDDTRKILEEAGILYSYEDIVSYTTIQDIKVAMISVYYFRNGLTGSKALLDKTIAEAKEQQADLIITSFHWGTEKTAVLTEEQIELGHYAVDCGAHLVVGHHPHVLQPIEVYNNCYIVYSLANFCFGGNTNPSDKDTMIFQQTFTFSDHTLQLENSPVKVIPCSVSSVTNKNNYQPTPQTGEEAARIMEKLNSYCAPYQLRFEPAADGTYIPAQNQPLE